MAKVDIQDAFRIVPVHPDDRWLLEMQWEGKTYIDSSLPFGLRSAPKIFNMLADALEWILSHKGVQWNIHYLNDFLMLGAPGTSQCSKALVTTLATCDRLGCPIAPHKTVGPVTLIDFLGIQLDSTSMQLRLPKQKLAVNDSKMATPKKQYQTRTTIVNWPPQPRLQSGETRTSLSTTPYRQRNCITTFVWTWKPAPTCYGGPASFRNGMAWVCYPQSPSSHMKWW